MNLDLPAALRLKLGALNVVDGPKTPFGAGVAAYPGSVEEAVDCVSLAREAGWTVMPTGCGTYIDAVAPLPPCSLLVSSRRLSRFIQHQPENLVITAEAGVTIA